jgi:hypothetical protein
MKIIKVLLLPLFLLSGPLVADTVQFVLVPAQTTIKPRQTISFDVYLINAGNRAAKAPLLDAISTVYWSHNAPGNEQHSPVTLEGPANFNPGAEQKLAPNTVQRKTIKVNISARPGTVVEVYAVIGRQLSFRSNSVLLHCATK